MKKTYEQFKDYLLARGGYGEARTTGYFEGIPAGTLIKFGITNNETYPISSYKSNLKYGDKQYESDNDIEWASRWKDNYKGLFEVEDEPTMTVNLKNTTANPELGKIEKLSFEDITGDASGLLTDDIVISRALRSIKNKLNDVIDKINELSSKQCDRRDTLDGIVYCKEK